MAEEGFEPYVPPTMPNWRDEAEAFRSMLTAAMFTGQMVAYPGVSHGLDVIIFGFKREQPDGRYGSVPLCIVLTDNIVKEVEVPHGTVNLGDG